MATISIVLLLLLAVVVSGVLVRLSPVPVPLPIVQIGLGAVLAYTSSVVLDPAVFFPVPRYSEWVETASGWQPEVEFAGDQINHGLEITG